MKTELKLMAVNVALAAVAAFLGALGYADATGTAVHYDTALFVSAGYAGLRAGLGLLTVYANRLSGELQSKLPAPPDGQGF